MWITFKIAFNKESFLRKVNIEKMESIRIDTDEIYLFPQKIFEDDDIAYVISKEANEGFEEIKKKLMEL